MMAATAFTTQMDCDRLKVFVRTKGVNVSWNGSQLTFEPNRPAVVAEINWDPTWTRFVQARLTFTNINPVMVDVHKTPTKWNIRWASLDRTASFHIRIARKPHLGVNLSRSVKQVANDQIFLRAAPII